MVKTCDIIGKLPRVLGDMPGITHEGRLIVFGGGSGEDVRDEILAIEPSGKTAEIGRLPRPSRGHQAVKFDDAVYLLGGFAEGTLADAYRLDLRDLSASPIAPMPRDSAWFTATRSGDGITVVGGFSIASGYWEDIAAYDPQQDRWIQKMGFPDHIYPKAVLGSNAAVALGDRILSAGGADTFDTTTMRANALDVCALLDPQNGRWERLPARIEPREGLVAVQHGKRIFLIGGMLNAPHHASDVIEVFDADDMSVETFARLRTGRTAPACGALGSLLLIAGGVTKGVFEMTDTIEAVSIDQGN